MITHEPCASRGDCYHVRGARKMRATWGKTPEAHEAWSHGGRIGVRNQPREAKVHGGRIGGRIGGPIGGRKNIENGMDFAAMGRIGGSIGGRKNVENGFNFAAIGCIGGRIQGHKNVESGHLASVAAKGGRIGGTKTAEIHNRLKPNLGEATVAAILMQFYPDVWADIIWQRGLSSQFSGVPDIRHATRVIGEYDGGGHHLKRDRTADDAAKDTERRAAGYVVVRETDPYILATKFAYAVRKGSGQTLK